MSTGFYVVSGDSASGPYTYCNADVYVPVPSPTHPFAFLLKFTLVYLFVCVHARMLPSTRLGVRRQLVGVISLIPTCGGFRI